MAKKVNKLDDIKKLMIDLNSTRKSLLNLRFNKDFLTELSSTANLLKSLNLFIFFAIKYSFQQTYI